MGRINHVLNLRALLIWTTLIGICYEQFSEYVWSGRPLIHFVEKKAERLLIVLETANYVQVLFLVEFFQLCNKVVLKCLRFHFRVYLDFLSDKLFGQLGNVLCKPSFKRERCNVF